MERIVVGMHVDIKRSDGRVHTAVVTELKKERNVVMVEWFEKAETKGKEIDLNQLLEINPTLRSRPSQVPQEFMEDDNDENETLYDDIPINSAPKRTDRRTIVPSRPPQPAAQPVTQIPPAASYPKVSSARTTQPSTKVPAPSTSRPRYTFGPVASSPVTTPVEVPDKNSSIMVRSADRLDEGANETINDVRPTKGSTVQNIERMQRDREERRAQQEKAKKAREMEKAIDPGNANYQFYSMIRDYQANVDYRPLKMSDNVKDSRISVCVRKRPLNKKELTKKEIDVITIPNRDHLIVHQPQVKVDLTKYLENQKFRFDYTFGENATNEMVYRFTAQPLVRTIFEQGFATCFAYGQTGSGKTHTMGGDFAGKTQDVSKGIYLLTAADVFKLKNEKYRRENLQVYCSFFEIYGGKLFDLLNGKNLLRLLEDAKKEVNVVGLREEFVENENEVIDLLKKGAEVRTAGTTSANANSSRSHAIFQIILKKNKKVWGKFSLIDLAGNERGQDTGNADRQTRMEGAEINKSLLALKECIRAMARNSGHIPFRGSKLTLVLRDSFVSENARTCMIAMVSPGFMSCDHSINTLRYADRVKELGVDENGHSAPLDDEEFMVARQDEEEDGSSLDDDDAEAELSLICTRNGTDRNKFEHMKVTGEIAETEEQLMTVQPDIKRMVSQFQNAFDKALQMSDGDQEKQMSNCVSSIRKLKKALTDLEDGFEKWQKLNQREAELSRLVPTKRK